MTCHTGEKWIKDSYKEDRRYIVTFTCKHVEAKNPARSIQMISAHSCNYDYAGTSDPLKFHMCKKKENLSNEKLYSLIGECCRTNLFRPTSYKNQWFRVDKLTVDTDIDDGGEALGMCEHFEMQGLDRIFVGHNYIFLFTK